MTRRVLRLMIGLTAVLLAVLAAPAVANAQDDAQEDTPSTSIDDRSRDLGLSFVAPDIEPSSDPADTTTVGGTGGDGELALTGTDVEPIAAVSIGLLAVGGAALVSSRRRLSDLFIRS